MSFTSARVIRSHPHRFLKITVIELFYVAHVCTKLGPMFRQFNDGFESKVTIYQLRIE